MANEISILFDAYHLYHLPQFDPLIDLLEKDDRFKVYYSTCSKNRKEEVDICSAILKKRPGTFVFDTNEKKRAKKIRDLDLDVFICGWSRYDLDSFVGDNTLVGMIYHGIGVKPSYWRDNHQRLDIRFVEGEYEEVSDLFAFSSGASVKREIRDEPQQTYIYRFEGGGKIKDEDWGIKYSFYLFVT